MLLGTSRYKGRPMAKHFPLPIGAAHFQQWLALFRASVDELFAGPGAEEAKTKAQSIGAMFEHRMNPNPLVATRKQFAACGCYRGCHSPAAGLLGAQQGRATAPAPARPRPRPPAHGTPVFSLMPVRSA